MTDLPTFESVLCFACGRDRAAVAYCNWHVGPRVGTCTRDGDHVHRTCACGNTWLEKTWQMTMDGLPLGPADTDPSGGDADA